MAENRTYKCYKTVTQAMSRDKIAYPGKVASLLLDAFIDGDSKIYASTVSSKNILGGKIFKNWRSELVVKGWINFVHDDKYSRYYPGPKLLGHVNKEKINSKEIATTDQLLDVLDSNKIILKTQEISTKIDVDTLKNRIDDVEKAIKFLIEKFDPPYDEKKRKDYLSLAKS